MEMPEMDGLAVLHALRQTNEPTSVIVVSALTRQGGRLTMQALEKGAFDFITKPDSTSADQSREALRRELAPRVRALAQRIEIRRILRQPGASISAVTSARRVPCVSTSSAVSPGSLDGLHSRPNRPVPAGKPELVIIGVSTGGPNALARLLPAIPRDIGVPILIVQHMPPIFTQSLAESLAAKCGIRVREAAAGDIAAANTAYIAPGGRHLRVQAASDGAKLLQITDDPPENNCRPSVDYLFRSVAQYFPGRSLAVILTGMGNDGTVGLRLLKRQGCFVIAQDEASCVVYGMPKAAFEAGVTDIVLPIDAIASHITSMIRGIKP
jgi:two-component system, chemotaxis family, protein-glutamate methylesterase/glutaminase